MTNLLITFHNAILTSWHPCQYVIRISSNKEAELSNVHSHDYHTKITKNCYCCNNAFIFFCSSNHMLTQFLWAFLHSPLNLPHTPYEQAKFFVAYERHTRSNGQESTILPQSSLLRLTLEIFLKKPAFLTTASCFVGRSIPCLLGVVLVLQLLPSDRVDFAWSYKGW